MAVNVTYDDLHRPLMGPENPHLGGSRRALAALGIEKNVTTGYVEEQAFSEYDFHTQYHQFQNLGYARDPTLITFTHDGNIGAGRDGSGYVGDLEKMKQANSKWL
jgi:pre-mRNA-processing factor 17